MTNIKKAFKADMTRHNEKSDAVACQIERLVIRDDGSALDFCEETIDERLEEVALLAAAWLKNRDKGKPSPILKRTLLKGWMRFATSLLLIKKSIWLPVRRFVGL